VTLRALRGFSRVKIRDSFTAVNPSKHILMVVNHRVNTFVSQVVDKFLDLVQVSLIVNSLRGFDSFPHHPKSDQVHTPGLEILDVRSADRVLDLV